MSVRYLLDTDILVYIRRGRPLHVLDRFRTMKPGDVALSVITYGELLFGIEKKQVGPEPLQRLQELVSLIQIMPLPIEAGRTYGTLRAALEARGEMIGNNDLWIASHALSADLTLVTNNEREFRRVDGLRIENWAK